MPPSMLCEINTMDIHPDFKELLELLNANHVEYLIVGGYALAFYGNPRFTGDLDLLVGTTPVNAHRIIDTLTAFGFASLGLAASDFEEEEQVVQLGVPPVRVDLITSISGVTWEEAWSGRTEGRYDDVPVFFLGRAQFLVNKRSTGRIKDLADLELMGGAATMNDENL